MLSITYQSKIINYQSVHFLVRAVLAAVFIAAGVLKAIDPAGFAADIDNYRVLPHAASVALSLYLPYLEMLCGAALLLRWLERGALALTGAMLAAFMLALASAWWRGLDIACGCFGTGGAHGGYAFALARDAALLAAVAVLWKREIAN